MEIIEDSLDESIDDVLAEPLFCFLGTVSAGGDPRVSPLWYLWEEGCMWLLADTDKTYTTRVQAHPATAVAVVDFDVREGHVRHIGMRGTAALRPFEPDRVHRKLRRYLGPDEDAWDPGFRDLDRQRWRLIKFEPDTVVARDQSYRASLAGQDDLTG